MIIRSFGVIDLAQEPHHNDSVDCATLIVRNLHRVEFLDIIQVTLDPALALAAPGPVVRPDKVHQGRAAIDLA
jgi:hypothetical protein